MIRTNLFTAISQAIGAWRRGEKRIAPAGATGRVYAQKEETGGSAGRSLARAKSVVLVGARVIRANGTVENLEIK